MILMGIKMQRPVDTASSTVSTIITASGEWTTSFMSSFSHYLKLLRVSLPSLSSCHCHKLILCDPSDVTLLHLDKHSVSNFNQDLLALSS